MNRTKSHDPKAPSSMSDFRPKLLLLLFSSFDSNPLAMFDFPVYSSLPIVIPLYTYASECPKACVCTYDQSESLRANIGNVLSFDDLLAKNFVFSFYLLKYHRTVLSSKVLKRLTIITDTKIAIQSFPFFCLRVSLARD